MKITSFNPVIVSTNAENVIKLFEDLGFEKHHAPVIETGDGDISGIRMKDANGNYVDVADPASIPRDTTYIRMNVDKFEEAYDILTEHGFRNTRGEVAIQTDSAKAATMVSPSGLTIILIEHIRENR